MFNNFNFNIFFGCEYVECEYCRYLWGAECWQYKMYPKTVKVLKHT